MDAWRSGSTFHVYAHESFPVFAWVLRFRNDDMVIFRTICEDGTVCETSTKPKGRLRYQCRGCALPLSLAKRTWIAESAPDLGYELYFQDGAKSALVHHLATLGASGDVAVQRTLGMDAFLKATRRLDMIQWHVTNRRLERFFALVRILPQRKRWRVVRVGVLLVLFWMGVRPWVAPEVWSLSFRVVAYALYAYALATLVIVVRAFWALLR